jgi:hypothetical protein
MAAFAVLAVADPAAIAAAPLTGSICTKASEWPSGDQQGLCPEWRHPSHTTSVTTLSRAGSSDVTVQAACFPSRLRQGSSTQRTEKRSLVAIGTRDSAVAMNRRCLRQRGSLLSAHHGVP